MIDLKKIAALTVIRAMPDMELEAGIKPGRLKNYMEKLKDICDNELGKFVDIKSYVSPVTFEKIHRLDSKIKAEQVNILEKNLNKWADATGWNKKQRHVKTWCSFFIAINEDYIGNPKISEIIEEIYKYYSKVKSDAVNWGGTLAYRKWIEIWEGRHE